MTRKSRISNPTFLPPEIKALINNKNRALKEARLTADPIWKREANRKQQEVKTKIEGFFNETWERNLSSLNPDDNSLWKLCKRLRKTTYHTGDGTLWCGRYGANIKQQCRIQNCIFQFINKNKTSTL